MRSQDRSGKKWNEWKWKGIWDLGKETKVEFAVSKHNRVGFLSLEEMN